MVDDGLPYRNGVANSRIICDCCPFLSLGGNGEAASVICGNLNEIAEILGVIKKFFHPR